MPKTVSFEEASQPTTVSFEEAAGKKASIFGPAREGHEIAAPFQPALDSLRATGRWSGRGWDAFVKGNRELTEGISNVSPGGVAGGVWDMITGLGGVATAPASGVGEAVLGKPVQAITHDPMAAESVGSVVGQLAGYKAIPEIRSTHKPSGLPAGYEFEPPATAKPTKAKKTAVEPVQAPPATQGPQEPQAAPAAAPEPAVSPPRAKKPRKPTVLGEGDTVSFEEAAGAAEELEASRGNRGRGAVPYRAIEAPDPVNLEPLEKGTFELAADLNKTLGLTHRQGRITRPNASGVFNIRTGVIRTRAMHEMDTLSHEGGHSLEFKDPAKYPTLQPTLEAHSAEIEALGHKYYGAKIPEGVERQEGFAEFFRLYLTNPELAKREAPRFYDAFEESMTKDQPEVAQKLREVQGHHTALMNAPSAVAAMSEVVTKPPKGPMATEFDRMVDSPKDYTVNLGHELYYNFINRFHGIQVAVDRMSDLYEKRTGKRLDLPAHRDPEKILQMAAGSRDAAMEDVNTGVRGYHSVEPTTPSLTHAIDYAMKRPGKNSDGWGDQRYHEFSTYLNARNMLQQWRRYEEGARELPPSRHPKGVYAQAIKTFETANPHWGDAAAQVYQWADGIWKLRHDAGFITMDQYIQGMINHPDYVPAQREMTNPGQDAFVLPIRGGGPTGKNMGGVQQMRGSTRNVVDPIYSLAQQAMELRMLIARNDAALALRDISRKVPNAGSIVEEISSKRLQMLNVGVEEVIQSAMKDRGLSERDELEMEQAVEMITDVLGEDARGKVFRAADINEHGEPIIYYWDKGKRGALQLSDGKLGKMMLSAFTDLNKPMQGMVIGALSMPARLLRWNVVTHPTFWAANLIKDQPVAAALTDVGYVPFIDWAKGVTAAIKDDPAFQRYKAAGGTLGGMQSAAERNIIRRRSLQEVHNRMHLSVKEMPEQAATFSELSETGTRVGLFMKAEAKAKGKGLDDYEAAFEGAHEATDILNFNRRGALRAMQGFQRMLPFLGANIQGLDKAGRVGFNNAFLRMLYGEAPRTPGEVEAFKTARNAWTWALGMAAASAAYRLSYGDDPEFNSVNETLRATHWLFKKGNGEYVAVPKPFEVAFPADMAERAVEAYLGDEKAPENAFHDTIKMLVPQVTTPPVIPIGLLTGKNYWGESIVPKGTEKMEPRDQKDIYTSWVAEHLPLVGGSPAKTDYVEQQLVGGNWMPDINRGIDRMMKDRPEMADNLPDMFFTRRFVREVSRQSEPTKQVWEKLEKIDPKYQSFSALVGSQDYDEAYKRLEKMTPDERSWSLVNTFGKAPEKQSHPLSYALKSFAAVSKASKDIQIGDLNPGPGEPPIQLDPKQRREAFEALRYLNMVQSHNAMVELKAPGFSHLPMMSVASAIKRLQDVDPRLDDAVQAYYQGSNIMPKEAADEIWNSVRSRYETMPSEDQFLEMAGAKGKRGRAGFMSALRPKPK